MQKTSFKMLKTASPVLGNIPNILKSRYYYLSNIVFRIKIVPVEKRKIKFSNWLERGTEDFFLAFLDSFFQIF